jgi:VWFA-related protein
MAAMLLAAALPASAQQNAPDAPAATPPASSQGPVLHRAPAAKPATPVAVKPISLLAVVRDKKGQPVMALTKDDLVLEQDGRSQAITQFAPQSDQPLILGILADTQPGQRKELADERKAGTDFVNKLREQDKGFVLHFDHEVELLQDITGSRDRLARGVDEISVGDTASNAHGRHRDDPGSDQPHYFFGGGLLYDAVYLTATEVLKDQHGRKAVIVFSDGVDHQSKVNLDRAIEAAQRADIVVYTVYVASERDETQQEQQGGYGRRGGGFPGGQGPFPGGGYPGGGGRRQPPQPEPKENKDAAKKTLKRLADETGGRTFEITKKELAAQIYAQIGDELNHQYGLVYTPDHLDAGYHRIKLSTKKSDMTVQTRDGFYGD